MLHQQKCNRQRFLSRARLQDMMTTLESRRKPKLPLKSMLVRMLMLLTMMILARLLHKQPKEPISTQSLTVISTSPSKLKRYQPMMKTSSCFSKRPTTIHTSSSIQSTRTFLVLKTKRSRAFLMTLLILVSLVIMTSNQKRKMEVFLRSISPTSKTHGPNCKKSKALILKELVSSCSKISSS